MLLEADGCCIDLNECASSSKQRERATINILQLADGYSVLTTKMRRDLCLAGFFQDLNDSVVVVVVGVHCSLKVADERLRFLVRVSFIITFRSLTVRYDIFAQSGREESSSVNAVH